MQDGETRRRFLGAARARTRGHWPRTALVVLAGVTLTALAVAATRLDLASLAAWLAARRAFVADHVIASAAVYFAVYVGFAALSLPGVWAIAVAGGALFGPWLGAPLALASSTAGATVAMLTARYLLRDAVAARFPDFVAKANAGVARDGARWLLAARLTPFIPFFVVNITAGLTRMKAPVFASVSFIGAAPLAVAYGLAGARLATIERASDVVSAPAIAVLAALGLATFVLRPFAARAKPSR